MSTTEHIFDEPLHFGEDGEWIIVRGDITANEAAKRIMKFEEDCGASHVKIKPESLAIAKVFKSVDIDGCEEYTLLPYANAGSIPENAQEVYDVWSYDAY